MNPAQRQHFAVENPSASQVYLIADFNDWSTTAVAMRRTDAGTWEADVELPPGTYRYAFFAIDSTRFPWRSSVLGHAIRQVPGAATAAPLAA